MANVSFKLIPKMQDNLIAIFIVIPSTGQSRQVALIECPTDRQMNDNVELANEFCKAYRKRMKKSV